MKDWRLGFTSTAMFFGTLIEGSASTGDAAIMIGRETNSDDVDYIDFAVNNEANRMRIINNGNVGIGTTSPYAKLSVVGEVVAEKFHATSTTATSTFAGGLDVGSGGLTYDFSSGITSIASAEMGNLNFDTDGGVLSWVDMPVVSALAGTVQSYSAQIDGNPLLTVYSESDGSGGIQNPRIGIGTTSPYAKLSVVGETVSEYFTATSTSGISTFGGTVGVATTSPWRTLAITGTVGFDGLTGSTGAGSLCLDSNKQVVYNSASDACLSSTRATKHDIVELSATATSSLSTVLALQPVSFIYNEGDGRTRLGFIAEDTASVDPRLATYNVEGVISGIDDRAILSVAVKSIQELDKKLSDLEQKVNGMSSGGENISSVDASGSVDGGTATTTLYASITVEEKGLFDKLFAYLETLGVKITEGLATFKKIATENLRIGSKEKPSGIVMYDEDGEAYCLRLLKGGTASTTPVNSEGECLEQSFEVGSEDMDGADNTDDGADTEGDGGDASQGEDVVVDPDDASGSESATSTPDLVEENEDETATTTPSDTIADDAVDDETSSPEEPSEASPEESPEVSPEESPAGVEENVEEDATVEEPPASPSQSPSESPEESPEITEESPEESPEAESDQSVQ
ncbi:MAG: hypothetical protein A3G52_00725 [Candidatus Taylorbacteria bacterium RIFCSPLOWO2_12_FULL_43_20]|uniref:Peptidase S74 domain-containing protein n=1 Tax=Candidatus Taylorbacteria bacterium RIFCSPLOWO2_12_FULL_43_20 TaxID=1802332 RepID=A0A1G2NZU7_9BACT|nr:MAG: hypothetical protein A3G52_00725 [Candidatus Taylorbacteria bacterium RIFCSPLOWO2_12_FULL_43_20]